MRFQAVRRAERYIGLAVLAGLSSAAGAQETQTSVLVSTGASVETNPYNDTSGGGAQIAATADIRPMGRWRDETTTIDLSGSAQFRQFLRRYGLEDSYGLDLGIVSRQSERVTLRTSAGFSSSDGGYNGFGRPSLSPAEPTVPIPPVLPPNRVPELTDVTLLGQRSRITSVDFGTGASVTLNANSSLSLDLTGRALRFKAAGFGDYDTVGAQLGYSYRLSELTSVGLIASVSKTDYSKTQAGDARVFSVSGSIDRRLGANWALSASGGMSFTKSAQGLGLPDTKFNSFTASVNFCRQGEFSQFCLNANRSPEPTANGGVRVSNTIAANYSLRVTDRERITVDGSFARTGPGRGFATALPAVKFVSASARYDNQLNQTMTAFASTNFSKIFASGPSRRANFGVNAGVQFRFGALQ